MPSFSFILAQFTQLKIMFPLFVKIQESNGGNSLLICACTFFYFLFVILCYLFYFVCLLKKVTTPFFFQSFGYECKQDVHENDIPLSLLEYSCCYPFCVIIEGVLFFLVIFFVNNTQVHVLNISITKVTRCSISTLL